VVRAALKLPAGWEEAHKRAMGEVDEEKYGSAEPRLGKCTVEVLTWCGRACVLAG
jgi:hypothetical protein